MKRAILTAVLLLIAGALVANSQTNTFCANNLTCTVTGAWNFTGGLQVGGVAVPSLPINLATQVTGTLPGANYAAVNLAGGNVNGGVNGTLPGPSVGVFVASGASHAVGAVPDPGSSAGTTRFLREDSTWVAPSSGSTVTVCTASSPVTVSNTNASTALLSCSVPANTLAAGTLLEVTLTGIESTATGATGTITLTTNLGGGTSVTTVSGTTGVCNAQPWVAKFYFTTITAGSGGTGNWSGQWAGNACSGSYGGTGGVVGNPTIAINTTIANTLQVNVTMAVANAGNSVTGQILKAALF
jgi:hypothetical protein